MSLQGSLRQLGLADVLQGAIAGRRGTLTLRRGATRAVLHVDANQLRLFEPDPIDPDHLLQGLIHRGLVPANAFNAADDVRTGIERLDHLLDTGVVPRPEVDLVLRGVAEDTILDLLTWSNGEFRFKEGEEPPESQGLTPRVGIDIGGVLLRSAQRLDEREAIADVLGVEAHLFIPLEKKPEPAFDGDPVLQIHALLDGFRVVEEVAILAGVSRFAVLRAVLACVESDCARAAEPFELGAAAAARESAGQLRIARSLLLQWGGTEPSSIEPLERLVTVARLAGLPEEEGDALLTLGHVLMQLGRAAEALPILRDLVAKRPGDTRALSALSTAAETAGDVDLYVRSVVPLAEAALRDDEPQKAAQLLSRLVSLPESPLSARMVRGRAFVQLRDAERLQAEAQAVARQIGKKCRRKTERDAVEFFRGAVSTLAPHRSDLLKELRGMTQGSTVVRRVALVAALILLSAVAGVLLWPESPASLLAKAEAAAAAGDRTETARLIAILAERHPDAPETGQAFQLQMRLNGQTKPRTPRPPKYTQSEEMKEAVARLPDVLDSLPDAEALAALVEFRQLLSRSEFEGQRPAVVKTVLEPLRVSGVRMKRVVRIRRDLYERIRGVASENDPDRAVLEDALKRIDTWNNDGFVARMQKVLEELDWFRGNVPQNKLLSHAVGGLRSALARLESSVEDSREPYALCQRRLLAYRVDAAAVQCRTIASRHVVGGRFDDAEACYQELDDLLRSIESDPSMAELQVQVKKRRLAEFVRDRRATIRAIRRGLASATAAEAKGDIETAVRAYGALATRFLHVRFENVVEMPLRVESVPSGARILVNGVEKGVTPAVVHYPFGSQLILSLELEGYEACTEFLSTREGEIPRHELAVRLAPKVLWTASLQDAITVPPLYVDGDVILCTRSGRVQRHDGEDGRVVWSRHIKTLEGLRASPVASGGVLYLPFVDGTLWILDLEHGQPTGTEMVGRPVGAPSVLDDRIAIATTNNELQVLLRREVEHTLSLAARPSTGVTSAHGAFWVGLADGRLARVDTGGELELVELPGATVPVRGLAAHDGGVLVVKADGGLHALDARGRPRWHAGAIGDVVGSPAVAAGTAACIDTRGRVLLFDVASGAPRGQTDLRAAAHFGLTSVSGHLASCVGRGRLWVYAPAADQVVVDVELGHRPRFPLREGGSGRLLVPAAGGGVQLVVIRRSVTTGGAR